MPAITQDVGGPDTHATGGIYHKAVKRAVM
jgi:hypothetical protein